VPVSLKYWPSDANFVLVRVGHRVADMIEGQRPRVYLRIGRTSLGATGACASAPGSSNHEARIAALEGRCAPRGNPRHTTETQMALTLVSRARGLQCGRDRFSITCSSSSRGMGLRLKIAATGGLESIQHHDVSLDAIASRSPVRRSSGRTPCA